MIVWLASYPRSGNTLMRRIIKKVFGIATWSLYREGQITIGENGLQRNVGDFASKHDIGQIYAAARDSTRLHVMKTHGAPLDDAPAIFLVRDGRAACVSYYHYLRDFENSDVSMADVVLGMVNYTSWSEHYKLWQPRSRANTLLLSFERLVENPNYALNEIADLLQVKPQRRYEETFAELHRRDPRFFRKGDNAANIAELQGEDASLFWVMHGELMRELGYVDHVPEAPLLTRDFLIGYRTRWEAILERRFKAIEQDRWKIALAELEADRAERGEVNARLQARLAMVEADQRAKEENIYRAEQEIRRLALECRSKDEAIASLSDEMVAIDGDRRAKDEVIARLTAEMEVLRDDHRARGEVIERLLAKIDQLKARP